MGTGYTRNDTTNNIADGNVINAADLDGEFDAIVTALSTGGHTHDGTAAEGGPVTVLGPAQDFVVSASIVSPKTDNTLDLGTSTLEFKDLYIDGTAYIDGLGEDLLVAGTSKIQFRDTDIHISSATDGHLDLVADTEIHITATTINMDGAADISGNLGVGGNLTVTGTTTFNGGTITLGDAAADNVVFGADVDSSIIPDDDDTYDLGSSGQQWRDIYIDGSAYIDGLAEDILVATDKKVQFRDTALFINSSADGQLDIDADVELEITAPTVDINASTAVLISNDLKLDSDAAVLGFGVNNDVTLTHVHDTALLLNDAIALQFRDSALAINSSADGQLDIIADVSLEITTPILNFDTDGQVINFGAGDDVKITHVHNSGLTFTNTNTSDNTPIVLQLKSEENELTTNEVIASIEFAAGDDSGTDAATIAAGIHAIAEAEFTSSANATKLVFTTGVSETAAASATAKMTLSSAGLLTIADDFMLKDGGTIGVASTNDAITIASTGIVTFKDDILIKDAGTIGSASDPDAIAISSGGVVAISATTAASSSTSGALTVAGGAGIAADLHVGDDLVVTGDATFNGDTHTFASTNSQDPLLIIKNTTNDANGSRLHFVKDKGAAGADGDDIGIIEFISDDADQAQTSFAKIVAEVSESLGGDEAGKLSFFVAESDSTNTALTAGLVIEGEHATDGEVDVTIAAGTASTTTVAGDLAVTTDATIGGTLGVTGVVTANAGVVVDNFTLDGTTLALSSGDFTLDVAADIILDAAGGDIRFTGGGTQFAKISNTTGNMIVESFTSNADILFQGSDGGANITALTLDMSDAGTAIFNAHVRLGDNKTASFGAGNDIEITSDGTNGTIAAGSGNLLVDVAGDITLNADGGDWLFNDGSVTLASIQNDGSDNVIIMSNTNDKDLKFLGIDNTNTITALLLDMSASGDATFSNSVNFPDNGKAYFGAGQDLEIYHDGSNSYIDDTGTGSLRIRSNRIRLEKYTGENMIEALEDGAVELYHNGVSKFETLAEGSQSTNSHSSTTLTDMGSNSTFRLMNASVGNGIYNALEFAGNQQSMFITSINNGTEANRALSFYVGSSGGDAATDEQLAIRSTGPDFNPSAANKDFRVRSDANDNAFLVDASAETICIGTSNGNTPGTNTAGVNFLCDGMIGNTRDGGTCVKINRAQDGDLVEFRSAAGIEGTISISGSTTTLNGFSGRHESSGIPTNTPIGTVVSTIDELDVYPSTQGSGNEQEPHPKAGQTRADHAKVKVSDTAGDACVYGVVGSFNEQDKVNVTSLGIGSVRVTGACSKGDLLESNGDGTAKVQSDDIVRSKTLGKVTIGNSNTGVKLVSCVMYCG